MSAAEHPVFAVAPTVRCNAKEMYTSRDQIDSAILTPVLDGDVKLTVRAS